MRCVLDFIVSNRLNDKPTVGFRVQVVKLSSTCRFKPLTEKRRTLSHPQLDLTLLSCDAGYNMFRSN